MKLIMAKVTEKLYELKKQLDDGGVENVYYENMYQDNDANIIDNPHIAIDLDAGTILIDYNESTDRYEIIFGDKFWCDDSAVDSVLVDEPKDFEQLSLISQILKRNNQPKAEVLSPIMRVYTKLLNADNNGKLYKNISLVNGKLIRLTLITTKNDADVTIENSNDRLVLTDGNETYNGSVFDTELLDDASEFFYDEVSDEINNHGYKVGTNNKGDYVYDTDEITEDNVIECINDMKSYIENVSIHYDALA